MKCFDPGWKCWRVSVLSYLQLSSRYHRPALQMSTCLSPVHGSIFLLYVYLFNKDVCWEIRPFIYNLHFKDISKMPQPPPLVVPVDFFMVSAIWHLYCFTHTIKVLGVFFVFEVLLHRLDPRDKLFAHLKVLKVFSKALTDACIFWFISPPFCLTLWFHKLSGRKKILYWSQKEQKGMEENDVYAETGEKKTL